MVIAQLCRRGRMRSNGGAGPWKHPRAGAVEQASPIRRDAGAELELCNVSTWFGGVCALDDVSLTVRSGEVVGIIGPNGAGKSTLLDVISGRRRPQRGVVLHCDADVTRATALKRSRRGIGRTFQQLSLFTEMTVSEHVLLGYMGRRREPGRSLARRRSAWFEAMSAEATAEKGPGLSPTALMSSLGLQAVAGELASNLPVGTARLVDLARALAASPRLLLLDEPVSGLSVQEATAAAGFLRQVSEHHEIAVVVVEHDLDFARAATDRLVALNFGAVIADGRPAEVLALRAVQEAYFGGNQAQGDVADVEGRPNS